ncbi:MAG TPA: phosphonate C-P lyase system protein PhnH, partial [Thermomicrobiales bacterium]|nr:phosphonate C-P lyase system protein PhnH [Thermomicrobiales bacterium]
MALRAELPSTTWDDPIRATQHVFRRTLDALAMPGSIQQLVVNPTLADLDASEEIAWPATLLL